MFMALFSVWIHASPQLVTLKEVYVDYAQYLSGHTPYLNAGQIPHERLNLNVNIELLDDWLYMNNTVHSLTDQSQFRFMGWEYELGINVYDYVHIYYQHFSGHLLDDTYQWPSPLDNTIGVKLYLYKKDR